MGPTKQRDEDGRYTRGPCFLRYQRSRETAKKKTRTAFGSMERLLSFFSPPRIEAKGFDQPYEQHNNNSSCGSRKGFPRNGRWRVRSRPVAVTDARVAIFFFFRESDGLGPVINPVCFILLRGGRRAGPRTGP